MEELIVQAQQGNRDAFTDLILTLKNDLYKIARTRLSNEDDIQEAIQETMIRAYKHIKGLKEPSKFKIWITKILINQCNTIFKKKKSYNIRYTTLENDYYKELNNNICLEKIEDSLNFIKMLEPLKYDEKLIIVLYYTQKYTTKEISNLLKIKENTIKSKLARAREKIKTEYKGGEEIG